MTEAVHSLSQLHFSQGMSETKVFTDRSYERDSVSVKVVYDFVV